MAILAWFRQKTFSALLEELGRKMSSTLVTHIGAK
jgi:hypothetical protein